MKLVPSKKTFTRILKLSLFIFIILISVVALKSPSNDREWTLEQSVLPSAEFNQTNPSIVEIKNIRDFKYTENEIEVNYLNKTYDLNQVQTVDYVVEPFSNYKGPAHTFLTFGFDQGEYLSISVEIRKEKHESFSPLKGLFNKYEIMYVIGTEEDLIKLRSNIRKDDVYVYPIKTEKTKIKQLLISMLSEANNLNSEPKFYNTITNTCTTNIRKHINLIAEKRVPFSYKVLLPAYSDELAYDLGFINTDLSFDEAREEFKINNLAEQHTIGEDFSELIRSSRSPQVSN